MNRCLPIVLVALLAPAAHAETRIGSLEGLWPRAAAPDVAPTLGKRVTERLVDYGYRFVATPIGVVTHRAVEVGIDPKQQVAKLAVHGGSTRVVGLRVALDLGMTSPIAAQLPPRFQPEPGRERDYIDDTRSSAVVKSRVALSIAGKQIAVDLPKLQVSAAELHGTRGVELTLPFVRRAL